MLSAPHSPKITVYHRSAFRLGAPDVWHWPADQTLAQIVNLTPLPDKADFMRRGVVAINGHEIPFAKWHLVRPRADNGAIVTLHLPVQGSGGGGGSSSKQAVAIVAAIAITIASAGAAGGFAAGVLGASFAAGTLGAALLGATISFAGSILVSSLSSAPIKQQNSSDVNSGGDASKLEPAAVQGNVLRANTPVPRVIGTRRAFPPLVAEPLPEYVGQDEFVHAVFCLAGPHKLINPRFDNTAFDMASTDSVDLHVELYDGLSGSALPDYPRKYSRSFATNVTLSTHGTDATNLAVFAPPLPVWHATNTADSPDECWLHFVLAGLIRSASPTDPLRIPVRIRLRLRGDTAWRDLPELHYVDATQSQRRMQVKLKFGESFAGPFSQPSASRGFVEARKSVPAQNVSPLGAIWNADSYFSGGAGNDIYSNATYATTNLRNVALDTDTVIFYLSSAAWPAGIYDIEVKRGATFRNADFVSSTYAHAGSVLDFFGSRDSGALPLTRDGLLDQVTLVRSVSVKNSDPVLNGNLSLAYVRARNRSVGNFSLEASGYVNDWNGVSWSNLTTTSNPAAHFRDILTGTLNFDAMPEVMVDDSALIEWRDVCALEGHRCDMVAEGSAVYDTLRIVASCGYARPYSSEVWGVIRDYDRSAETPVQIFSSRNSRDFAWQKAFPKLPDGLLVNFKDEETDYTGRQIVVYRTGGTQLNARTEQVSYEGIVDRNIAIARAEFDLAQVSLRSAIYSFEAPVESIVCRRGSLIGINHDILLTHTGSARVIEVVRNSAGLVTSVYLDAPISTLDNDDMLAITNMLAVTDMLTVGIQTAVAVRKTNGSHSVHAITGTGETDFITFATPYADNQKIKVGCLLVAGAVGTEYKRLIVSEITPGQNLTAVLTLVDEAPELWI